MKSKCRKRESTAKVSILGAACLLLVSTYLQHLLICDSNRPWLVSSVASAWFWNEIRPHCQAGLVSALLKILFTAPSAECTFPLQSPTTEAVQSCCSFFLLIGSLYSNMLYHNVTKQFRNLCKISKLGFNESI